MVKPIDCQPRVSFFTNGELTPSSRFRVYEFLKFPEISFEYSVRPSNFSQKDRFSSFSNFIKAGALAKDIFNAGKKGDRFFLQRMLVYKNNIALERLLFKYAKNGVIVDFDDAIFLGNPRFSYSVQNADLTIAGNSILAEWASKYSKNVKIIPTCIDTDRFFVRENRLVGEQDCITIGWTGTKDNLKYLGVVADSLRRLNSKYNFKLLLIGDFDKPPGILSDLRVEIFRWNEKDEVSQLKEIDIGLMPLVDDEWTRGKCGFKLLQYMAVGVLSIGSRVGVNAEIIKDGKNGFLCSSENEWYKKLEMVLSDYKLGTYDPVVEVARSTVEDFYSIRSQYDNFIDAVIELK
jgi:glycosyltransferase involved in cell wall biosynthesis